MAIDVTVLRVFTDRDGKFGNPLGVVDAKQVNPAGRQQVATQLGYSETVFVDLPAAGATTAQAAIYTPRTELPFAGHPTVGLSWWLRETGVPINTLKVPAGLVQVSYEDAEAYATWRGARMPSEAEWEVAARGGLEAALYSWGDERHPEGRQMANTWQGEFPWQNHALDGYEGTSPIGAFPANGAPNA